MDILHSNLQVKNDNDSEFFFDNILTLIFLSQEHPTLYFLQISM